MNPVSELSASLDAVASELPGNRLPWLSELRREALDGWSSSDFQRAADRYWQLSDRADKQAILAGDSPAIASDQLTRYQLADAYSLVFVDGRFAPEYSRRADLPEAVTVLSLAEALEICPESLQIPLENLLDRDNHALAYWVAAWFQDGIFIQIPAGIRLEKPIQIITLGTASGTLLPHRHIITLGKNAEATVLETYAGQGDVDYFTATTTEVVLAENAGLNHYKLQVEAEGARHFGDIHAKLERSARFRQHHVALGGQRSLTVIETELGRDAECELDGLFHANQSRHIETLTRLEHTAPHASSREHYRGLATDRAKGVFTGKIVVNPEAQKTQAEMHNRNLLLSADAEIDSMPQLEIHADDVRCAHGVTVGQLDADAVFFLTARGLNEAEARTMLSFAFANEIIEKISLEDYRHIVLDAFLAAMPQSDIRQDWL